MQLAASACKSELLSVSNGLSTVKIFYHTARVQFACDWRPLGYNWMRLAAMQLHAIFSRASGQHSAKSPVFRKHTVSARTIIWIKKWGNHSKTVPLKYGFCALCTVSYLHSRAWYTWEAGTALYSLLIVPFFLFLENGTIAIIVLWKFTFFSGWWTLQQTEIKK